MNEFDDLISNIRKAAREQADYRIKVAIQSAMIQVAFDRFYPELCEEKREQILKAAEDEAVRKIYAHLHDVAIKTA